MMLEIHVTRAMGSTYGGDTVLYAHVEVATGGEVQSLGHLNREEAQSLRNGLMKSVLALSELIGEM